jgi:hypothetical protein
MDAGAVELVLRTAALVAAVALIFTKGVRPVFRFFKALDDGVSFVRAQMENNGGSSLRDAIDRTEGSVAKLEDRFDRLDDRVELLERIHERQELVDRIVADNAAKSAARPRPYLSPKESA